MQYTINNVEGEWTVTDELDTLVGVYETRGAARAAVRILKAGDSETTKVTHMEGTYGTEEHGTETAAAQEQQVEVVQEQKVEKVEQVEAVVEEQATQAEKTVITVVAVETVDATGKALKKSERVRIRIRIAKQRNESQEDVIKWTMNEIGFARGLAKVYVTGNWHKA